MSTDPSKNTAKDFINLLDLQNYTFPSFDSDNFIHQLFNSVAKIWQDVQSPNYTNHDTGHSYRICEFFHKFEAAYQWSKYEKLVFLAAALIHDIGMQYNSWGKVVAPYIKKSKKFVELTNEKQRQWHVDHGFMIIDYFLSHSHEKLWATPPAFCDPESAMYKSILRDALTIASAHSKDHSGKDTYLKKLGKASLQTIGRDTQSQFRFKLLAMMLRICDELDGNHTRVRDFERLFASDITDETRKHWFANIFVHSVALDLRQDSNFANKFSIHIKINWQIPTNCQKNIKNDIRLIVEKTRLTKLTDEIEKAKKFLLDHQESHLFFPTYVEQLGNTPSEIQISLTDQLIDSVSKIAEQFRPPKKINTPKKKPSPELKLFLESSKPIQEKLQNWFNENKIEGHIMLTGGLHTDTYLHCRNLVADFSLVHEAATNIHDYFSKLNKRFDCVVGVGTSAIPLAVAIAARFRSSVSFTVAPINISPLGKQSGHRSLTLAESRLDCFEKKQILVVDDVIASGRVASDVIKRIIQSAPKSDSSSLEISHAAIFRLGNLDISFEQDFPTRVIVSYYITHLPDVAYHEVVGKKKYCPEKCPICKRTGLPAQEEIEIL